MTTFYEIQALGMKILGLYGLDEIVQSVKNWFAQMHSSIWCIITLKGYSLKELEDLSWIEIMFMIASMDLTQEEVEEANGQH